MVAGEVKGTKLKITGDGSWVLRGMVARIIHAELRSRAHCRDRVARDLCASGAFRSAAQPRTSMNNPRGSTLSQRTGHPDDAPWSMNNPG